MTLLSSESKYSSRPTFDQIGKAPPAVGADELYAHLRGPGTNRTVLATAYSDPANQDFILFSLFPPAFLTTWAGLTPHPSGSCRGIPPFEEVKMKFSRLSLLLVAFLPAVCLAGTGCAPVFSDLQSAKLVGRNHHEFTANATRVSFSSNDPNEDGLGQTELGIQFAAGVNERVDLRARYVLVEGVHVVGLGPKVGLVRDRIALFVPIGLALNGEDSLQVHPTLIGTLPAGKNVELNGSLKYLIPLTKGGGDTLAAFNLGLGIGPARWKLRPEVGLLWNPGEEGHFAQFSLGVSFFPGR